MGKSPPSLRDAGTVPPDPGRTTQAAAAGAVAVRRWDDAAKDPAADVPGFARYRPLLDGLLLAG